MGVSKATFYPDRFIGTTTEYQRGVSWFPGVAFQKITFCVPNKNSPGYPPPSLIASVTQKPQTSYAFGGSPVR
jgi:hypothetical protein